MTKCFAFVPLPTPFSNQLLPVKAAQVYNVPIHSPDQSGDALATVTSITEVLSELDIFFIKKRAKGSTKGPSLLLNSFGVKCQPLP